MEKHYLKKLLFHFKITEAWLQLNVFFFHLLARFQKINNHSTSI